MVETFFLETLRGLSQSAANYTFAQDYSTYMYTCSSYL